MQTVGWDEGRGQFVDLDLDPIEQCFKLYPWEWLWREEFGLHLSRESARWIEPAWKMLVSNKGLLPILWELFPGHPNLLPAFEESAPLACFIDSSGLRPGPAVKVTQAPASPLQVGASGALRSSANIAFTFERCGLFGSDAKQKF